jgi:hypothetical protein
MIALVVSMLLTISASGPVMMSLVIALDLLIPLSKSFNSLAYPIVTFIMQKEQSNDKRVFFDDKRIK